MGSVLYVVLIVSLVQFQVILCKPFLFDFLCDLVCDDDDNTTSSSRDDYFGFGDICSCGSSPTQAPPTTKRGNVPNVDLNLPGVSLQMTNNNGLWSLSVNAKPSSPANSVIPLPTSSPVGPAVPVAPGGPPPPAVPGSPPIPAGPSSPLVPAVTGAPPGPTTAAATPAAAAPPAPP